MQLVPAATCWRMAAICLGALAIGLAYNAMNPAGLKWREAPSGQEPPITPYTHQIMAITPGLTKPAPPAAAAQKPDIPAPVYKHSTVSIGWPGSAQPPAAAGLVSGIAKVTWAEVRAMRAIGQVVLVDGRSRQSYEASHIPGAVSLPLGSLPSEIQSFKARYGVQTPLVVYCSNERCSIAEKLARSLLWDHGYRNVSTMPGGYLEYRANHK